MLESLGQFLLESCTDPATLLVFLAAFLLTARVWLRWGAPRRRGRYPPGPRPLPLVGNMLGLDTRAVYRTFTSWGREYGDVYTIYLLGQPVIVLNGYDTVHDVLVRQGDKFMDRPDLYIPKAITGGKGVIFQSYGPIWKEVRRLALTTMRDFGVGKNTLEEKIIEEVDAIEKEIVKHEGRPFSPRRLVQNAMANVICAINFGKRFDYEDPKFQKLLDLINQFFGSNVMINPANFFPWLRHLPGLQLSKPLQIMKETRQLVEESVAEHRATFDPDNLRDFVDVYLKAEQEYEATSGNGPISSGAKSSLFVDGQLFQVIHDLFNAGSETAATSVTWVIYYLLKYPNIQDKCYEQIQMVLGDRRASIKDKPHLPYVEAVILETQRVANTLPVSPPHAPIEDVHYREYFIPKGTMILANFWSVHHDPKYWSDPHRYNPSRWVDSDSDSTGRGKIIKHDAFMPFSAGRRTCLGMQLAQMEMFLVVTSLVQRFKFTLSAQHPLPDDQGVAGVTRSPKPYYMLAQPRT